MVTDTLYIPLYIPCTITKRLIVLQVKLSKTGVIKHENCSKLTAISSMHTLNQIKNILNPVRNYPNLGCARRQVFYLLLRNTSTFTSCKHYNSKKMNLPSILTIVRIIMIFRNNNIQHKFA